MLDGFIIEELRRQERENASEEARPRLRSLGQSHQRRVEIGRRGGRLVQRDRHRYGLEAPVTVRKLTQRIHFTELGRLQ